MPERVALYPGSFDPVTNGHLDVLFRARRLADRVILAILENDEKKPLFSLEERLEMVREIIGDDPGVSVRSFSGLTVDFAHETVFLMAKEEYSYVSSRLVKEVARLGADVSGLVPEPVRRRLEALLPPSSSE
jgi:pantetheine-phosphate adenylyltransferase